MLTSFLRAWRDLPNRIADKALENERNLMFVVYGNTHALYVTAEATAVGGAVASLTQDPMGLLAALPVGAYRVVQVTSRLLKA